MVYNLSNKGSVAPPIGEKFVDKQVNRKTTTTTITTRRATENPMNKIM